LEEKISGAGDIDPSHLRSRTRYIDIKEDDDIIKWFWEMFENWSPNQRSRYIGFVYGRTK